MVVIFRSFLLVYEIFLNLLNNLFKLLYILFIDIISYNIYFNFLNLWIIIFLMVEKKLNFICKLKFGYLYCIKDV